LDSWTATIFPIKPIFHGLKYDFWTVLERLCLKLGSYTGYLG